MHEAVQHFNTSYATIRKHLQRGDKEFLAFDRTEAGRKLAKSAKGRKRTDAQRQHMRDTRGGAQHPCAKRVVVNGKEYGCLKDAAKDQGVNYSTLRWRFQGFERSGLWPDGFAVFTN
jgi:transposase